MPLHQGCQPPVDLDLVEVTLYRLESPCRWPGEVRWRLGQEFDAGDAVEDTNGRLATGINPPSAWTDLYTVDANL
jgi:hypothetical protein